MRALIVWIWNGLGSLAAFFIPIFDKTGAWRHISRGLRWAIHILLVVGAVIGLHYLNRYYDLGRYIPRERFLGDNWLPILFLLCYLLGWLAWGCTACWCHWRSSPISRTSTPPGRRRCWPCARQDSA